MLAKESAEKTMRKIIILFLILMINIVIIYGETVKKTIMIDLDGVLDNYTVYTNEIPSIRNGAKDFIKKLAENYELILFTTRNSKQAVEWLKSNNIDKYFKNVTNVKTPAYIYIDDRAIKFDGDFDKTLNDIENFTVHWKK